MEQNININSSKNAGVIQVGGGLHYYWTERPLLLKDNTNNMSKTSDAGKKVFISSTCFDLKDLRAELAEALKEWGYLPIWSESPNFPKKHGLHSHDVCLDTVRECDIFLLIIDKRYGSTYAGNKYPKKDISITQYEAEIAFQENKDTYIFVRDEVWNERFIYKKNLEAGSQIKPCYVDDLRVFEFIDFIDNQPRDNWIETFKNSVELKEKLKIRLKKTSISELLEKLEKYYEKKLKEML